jgi:phospho-N-acetylmuramoyl-pentapeptide-transferase
VAHLAVINQPTRGPTASGLLVLGLMTGLGLVGFLDDFIKIRKQRSLGLNALSKFTGQLVVGVAFAVAALQFRNEAGLTPASTQLSFVRDYAGIGLGSAGFVLFAYLVITATSNAVNLTDGLDGLAAGSSIMVFGAYVAIGFWQFRNSCVLQPELAQCYTARDPLDIALVAAAAMGACFGFLWWNCSPAKIFMGDTGSLAIGGAFAGIAIVTQTQLLLVVLGGLFVIETLSVIIQIGVFKLTRKRVFNMAPIHHHFELAGWVENTVIVRFWIIAGLAVAFGLGVFYAEYLATGPLR